MSGGAPLSVGLSPCPNDTFAFHGLLTGRVPTRGLDLEFAIHDVQELNERLAAGEFDVAKASFFSTLRQADELCVLGSGSALGFGVGPVLLAREDLGAPEDFQARHGRAPRVLCPGEGTTAHLLFRTFHPDVPDVTHAIFSDIVPALERGDVDYGVCIHEGRFTYEERGLALIEDLGNTWERELSCPLPLGGLVARKRLGADGLARFARVLRDSIDYAHAHRAEALETMRRHAQEFDDDVLWAHVELYVNEWTRDLGEVGGRALAALRDSALRAGLVPAGTPELEQVAAWDEPPPLYHLADRAAWEAHDPREPWRPASLESEGFVHLSHASQLRGSLEAHFAPDARLVALELAGDVEPLKLERSRDGALFPHLHGPLPPAAVVRAVPVGTRGGRWDLAALGL